MTSNSMRLLNYNIVKHMPRLPILEKSVINTINPHSYRVANEDALFKEALNASDFLLPDGIGIVWAARVLLNKKIKKIAGYDMFIHLMEHLEHTSGSCFFLGASESTLTLIKERINLEYPNVSVSAFSPPYRTEFSQEESAEMCNAINAFNPNVVFVGMTAPKQEKWTYQHKNEINASIICSIGAVFDFYAGTVKRASPFWINLGLEWLPRFIKDPIRLANRNLVSIPKFIVDVLRIKYLSRQEV